jgi:hypothetical protein
MEDLFGVCLNSPPVYEHQKYVENRVLQPSNDKVTVYITDRQ